jgi:alpha-galactosidase
MGKNEFTNYYQLRPSLGKRLILIFVDKGVFPIFVAEINRPNMKTKSLNLLWMMLCMAIHTNAFTIQEGSWKIVIDETNSNLMTVSHAGNVVMNGVYSCAVYDNDVAQNVKVTTQQGTLADHRKEAVTDNFGSGRVYTNTYRVGAVDMIQQLFFYDQLPYFIVRLNLTQSGKQIASNYMAPLASDTPTTFLPAGFNNRMIYMPYDNDAWVRFQSYYLKQSMNSFNATAIFNADSRYGMVVGAIDHDTWKSAIQVKASNYNKVESLVLLSGYVDKNSRDSIAHGKVVGDTVKSSRFMVGVFDDWRQGLETYADANNLVVKGRTWAAGAPYGWNSWGVLQEKVNYQSVIDAMAFIHDNLMPNGFYDKQGKVLMSLDSYWTNLNDKQMLQFVDSCKKMNMIPGAYMCPFADWGGWDRPIDGTSQFTWKDTWLKVDGKTVNYSGALCMDPTHPATKISIKSQIDRMKRLGIKYIKMDFMSHGAIEADRWYNKDVHTGMQAYNEGMAFIRKQCGDDICINLSISPIFPYQYTEGRRISCDAYSSIDNTQYVMNSTSYGWWIDRLYAFNDPDNLVLKSIYQNGTETKGENRARITSGAVTGMFTVSDNFSSAVDRGYPSTSRELAKELCVNPEINEIARTCKSFHPVNGNEAPVDGAENLMTFENDDYLYLAVINYNKAVTRVSGNISFERLDINPDSVESIKELWTGADVSFSTTGFSYNVPAKDARIYRVLKKKVPSGIADVTSHQENSISVVRTGSKLFFKSPVAISRIQAITTQGKVMAVVNDSSTAEVGSFPHGLYLFKVETVDGERAVRKIML